MRPDQLDFLDSMLDANKRGIAFAEEMWESATALYCTELHAVAEASKTLALAGVITEDQMWTMIGDYVCKLAESQNITRHEVFDYSRTINRLRRELSDLEAA